MGVDPAHIINKVIIFLFIKTLYNTNFIIRAAGMKVNNTLADTFKLAHHSLSKL